MRLYGVEVSEDDCIILIDLLLRVGREVDHTAAAAIRHGLSMQAKLIVLSPAERDAILGSLGRKPSRRTHRAARSARPRLPQTA